jgi:hypothetical protein
VLSAFGDALVSFAQVLGAYAAPIVDWTSSTVSSVADDSVDAIMNTDAQTWLVFCAALLVLWGSFFRRL